MEHGNRGETALNAGHYAEAISHYTKAITASPEGATYYLKRSIAHQRLTHYDAALHDAENAVILATKRAKREMIAQGQLRRGIALYFHEKYGDAAYCFGLAKELDEKEKSAGMWEDKAKLKLKDLPEDDVRRKITIVKVPDFRASEATSDEDLKATAPLPESSAESMACLLYTSPSPRDGLLSRMPSSA